MKKKQVLDRQTSVSSVVVFRADSVTNMGKPGFVCIEHWFWFGMYRDLWRIQGVSAVGSGPVLHHYWVGEEDRRKLVSTSLPRAKFQRRANGAKGKNN